MECHRLRACLSMESIRTDENPAQIISKDLELLSRYKQGTWNALPLGPSTAI
jgi:hypothetical protein